MALPARRPETIVLAERWLVKCEGVFSRFVPIARHARGAMGESSAQSLQWRNHAPGISLPGAAGVSLSMPAAPAGTFETRAKAQGYSCSIDFLDGAICAVIDCRIKGKTGRRGGAGAGDGAWSLLVRQLTGRNDTTRKQKRIAGPYRHAGDPGERHGHHP